jgi:cysteine desulfurase
MTLFRLPVYLDYNATTPVDSRVLEAMLPYFCEHFGNPASRSHAYGWRAEEAVENARRQVASLVGASAKEIVFTSGATESNNLAIRGVVEMSRAKGNHIITCRTEHKAVLDVCAALAESGWEVTYLTPDADGCLTADQVDQAVTDRTILISLMVANNETGVLHPIEEIGRVAKRRDVLFHTDATQAVGRLPVNVQAMGVDLLSLSAHKMYGPKGTGALYVRARGPRVRLAGQILGGGHERGLRSGTLNVPGIVGLGKACEITAAQIPDEAPRLRALRDRLERGIAERLPHVKRNGHAIRRLPNTSNLSFGGVEGQAILLKLRDLAVSSGSACTSASPDASFVLRAMGVEEDLAGSAIRFSLGRPTTEAEIDFAVQQVTAVVAELRGRTPRYEQAVPSETWKKIEWIDPAGEPDRRTA